jgi:hypothetical protein
LEQASQLGVDGIPISGEGSIAKVQREPTEGEITLKEDSRQPVGAASLDLTIGIAPRISQTRMHINEL